jgi:hypothetical protein
VRERRSRRATWAPRAGGVSAAVAVALLAVPAVADESQDSASRQAPAALVAANTDVPVAGDPDAAPQPQPLVAQVEDGGGTDADVTADAEGGDGAADEGDGGGRIELPVSISLGMSSGFALGTVFRDNYTTTDSVSLGLSLSVSRSFWDDRLSGSVSASYSKNLTPTGINRQYEGRFGDIGLGLGYGNIYTIPVAGIGIGASLGASLPVSEISRFEGLITALDAGVSLSRGFGLFSLSYSLGVGKNFHRYTSQTVNIDRRNDLDLFYRTGGAEEVAENRVALDTGVLPEWSVSNSLSFRVRWFETGLSSSIGWSFSDSFTYAVDGITERDEFTAENAVPGRGHSQSMGGSIGLSYSFLQYFGASMTLRTGGPPKTADNQRIRFPFWDTQSGNLSYTSLSFGLSASI